MYKFNSDQIAFTIKKLAQKALLKARDEGVYRECLKTITTPIDYFRVCEFPSALSMLNLKDGMHVLDISSPQWFSLYLAYSFPNVKFYYINILENEIICIENIAKILGVKNISYQLDDIRETKLPNNFFDLAISISVIEHIYPEEIGDIIALNNIRKVLKNKDSEIIITLPIRKKRKTVYAYDTVYERVNLSGKKNFFARLYDEESLNIMLSKSEYRIIAKEYLIEKRGLFALDYCRGEGKDKISRIHRKAANLLSKRFQHYLAKRYLRGSNEHEDRLIGITLKSRSI